MTGSYASIGTVGTDAWSGIGTFSYTNVDANNVDMNWSSDVSIQPPANPLRKRDRESIVPKRWFGDPPFHFDIGKIQRTSFGLPVGMPLTELSIDLSIGGRSSTRIILSRGVTLNGSANSETGTAYGTTSVVPEPSSLALLGTGALFLMGCAVRKRRSR